ncbi:MAG: AEC family transporter [Hyphomicrobiales bacterium]
MELVFSIVLPVFGLIGVGWLSAHFGYLKSETGDGLTDFVFRIGIPLLIFRTIATADFSGAQPWSLWGSYFSGALIAWILGTLVIRRIFQRDARAGVVAGVSSAFSNTVLIGIPLTLRAYGDEGVAAVFLLISIHLPLMMLTCTILQQRAMRQDGLLDKEVSLVDSLKAVLQGLITNPIIVGIVVGGIWYLLGLPLSGLPETVIGYLANVAGALALFAMGMSLRRYEISGQILPAIYLSLIKLSIMPAIVLVMALYIFPLPPIWVKAMVATAACPVGVNTLVMADYFKTGQALASNTIAISTAISVGTIALWLYIVELVV